MSGYRDGDGAYVSCGKRRSQDTNGTARPFARPVLITLMILMILMTSSKFFLFPLAAHRSNVVPIISQLQGLG